MCVSLFVLLNVSMFAFGAKENNGSEESPLKTAAGKVSAPAWRHRGLSSLQAHRPKDAA